MTGGRSAMFRESGGDPVLDLLISRIAGGSRPGHRAEGDTATLALVVEGGGMRGVVSSAMLTALEGLGARDAFDVAVGTSAGALNAAYFLAGQSRIGTSVYYEDLIGREWVDFSRLLRRRPVVGLDWLIDVIVRGPKGLDYRAHRASGIPLYAVATRLSDCSAAVLGDFRDAASLRDALRASARIPLLAGAPVAIGGDRFLDGSLTEAIPVGTAFDRLGATHALVLLTRPAGRRPQQSPVVSFLLRKALDRAYRGLGEAIAHRPGRYRDQLRRLESLQSTGRAHVIRVPRGSPGVGQLEQSPALLLEGALRGAAAVHEALTGRTVTMYAGIDVV